MKTGFRILAMLLCLVMLLSSVGCSVGPWLTPIDNAEQTPANPSPSENGSGKKVTEAVIKKLNNVVPLTDLASTWKGDATDEEGRLLAPFDVVYSEAFATGDYKYDTSSLLLKMKPSYTGDMTSDLIHCGFSAMEKFLSTKEGDWYRATLSGEFDIHTAIQKARSLEKVLVADYDYQYDTTDTAEDSSAEESTETDGFIGEILGNSRVLEQWYLKSCSLQKAWKFLQQNGIDAGGSSSVVVAVIDTGVDYTHSDLKANMWVNIGEISGNGIDDDGNGYIDDVYGVNVIANNGATNRSEEGSPMDDHGHGTHVAGIISASNNKVGTVGVAYNAKIMAIKAGQATGVFNQSDIAEGILYAYEMGADVINMSFGGSACSIAVQDALETAYTRCTLIAAAGNNGFPNEATDSYPIPLPSYPGALSYVVGVMSVGALGFESGFTNWDATAYNTVEYEVYAPGEKILSTLPGEKYGYLSGTSMAAPVVSGIAALLRSYFNDRDMYPSKFITAQICSTSGESATCCNPKMHTVGGMPHNLPMIADAYSALTKLPKPEVTLYNYYLFGQTQYAEGNSDDGVADAGETIAIGLVLRNRWGMSKDTVVTVDAPAGLEGLGLQNPYITIVDGTKNFDGVGTYSTKDNLTREGSVRTGVSDPFIIQVSKNCPNDYLIDIRVTITCGNGLDENDNTPYSSEGHFCFYVRNGYVLPSQINEDMTLTKDNYYIIPNATYIAEGVTVTVEAGTKIQFYTNDPKDEYADTYIPYLNVAGKFVTNGTADEPVTMFPSDMMDRYVVDIRRSGDGYVELNYTTVTNPFIKVDVAERCLFNANYASELLYRYLSNGSVYDRYSSSVIFIEYANQSVFYKLRCNLWGGYDSCIFYDCGNFYSATDSYFRNCIFSGNNIVAENGLITTSSMTIGSELAYSLRGILRNSETGTTYLAFGGDIALPSSRKLAKELGGDFVCFETMEELEYFCDASTTSESVYASYMGFSVGLNLSNQKWFNGADYTLSIYGDDIVSDSEYLNLRIISNEFYSDTFADYQKIGNTRVALERCSTDNYVIEIPGSVYCDTLQMVESDVEIDTESTYQVLPQAIPTTFDLSTLIFVSDDPSVATVDENGLVTPLKEGEVNITAYSPDYQVSAVCHITVKEKVALEDFTVTVPTEIGLGESAIVQTAFQPANTTERALTFTSSDTSVLTVDGFGTLQALKVGTATITVEAKNIKKEFLVRAMIAPTALTFTQSSYLTKLSDTDESWKPEILPSNATDATVRYTSSNPAVAYVDESGNLVRRKPAIRF